MSFPKGENVCTRSSSVKSAGKWYMNRLAPSGPSRCFSCLLLESPEGVGGGRRPPRAASCRASKVEKGVGALVLGIRKLIPPRVGQLCQM